MTIKLSDWAVGAHELQTENYNLRAQLRTNRQLLGEALASLENYVAICDEQAATIDALRRAVRFNAKSRLPWLVGRLCGLGVGDE